MRRRGVTVILGALLTALLAVGVMAAPLPYVVLKPGPTVNTLGTSNGADQRGQERRLHRIRERDAAPTRTHAVLLFDQGPLFGPTSLMGARSMQIRKWAEDVSKQCNHG